MAIGKVSYGIYLHSPILQFANPLLLCCAGSGKIIDYLRSSLDKSL